jgi:YbbR domain-containing protein
VAPGSGADQPLGRTGSAVTRVIRVLLHNWPLKLAAIGLATLLYGGLVFAENTQTFPGSIPVEVRGQPTDTFMLTDIEPVATVRYLSPSGARPITSTFEAWIDVSGIEPGSGPHSVPINVESIDDRITVVGKEPDRMTVNLDKVSTRIVPVRVAQVAPPDGLELGPTTVDPTEVEVSGPASVLDRVVEARANVQIQPTGINVDQDVRLVPVDAVGDVVSQVEVDPATAHVTIPVFSDRDSKTLTITPLITGDPAPGFELVGTTVSPQVVTVEGDIDELDPLVSIDTAPVSIVGLSSSETFESTLVLPTGVVALDVDTVRVTITLRAVTATRTYEVGLDLVGARPDRTYSTSTDRVLITLGGSVADLDRLQGSTLLAKLDVTGLEPGTTSVPVTTDLPAGIALVSASPDRVAVTVAIPPSPSPAAGSPSGVAASPSPGR